MSEQRKHTRHKAHDGIIALTFDDVCRLSDISEGGAALTCIGRSNIPPKFSLQILMRNHVFYAHVPVKLAWEKGVEFSPFSSIFTKKIGIEFDNLTGEGRSKINYLVGVHQKLVALAI